MASIKILWWNVRRIRPSLVAKYRNRIIPVIARNDVSFIIENMRGTNEVVDLILDSLDQYGDEYHVFFTHMGGTKEQMRI